MAQSYIGKIAGIVTLNTRDVTVGVNRSVKELDSLGKSIRSIIGASNRDAAKSFDAIFTPIQKLQAAVRAANAQPLKLIDDRQTRQIEALTKATRDIFAPLAEGSRQISQLGANAQAAFLPALEQIQNKALLVNRAIAETGTLGPKSYATMQRQVEATTQAVTRLGEATRLASRGPTGNELAFRSPRANEALSGSAAAREAAGGLSAGRLASSNIANQVRFLAQLDKRIIETQARIERIKLNPQVNTKSLEAYEFRLQRLASTSKSVQASINAVVNADRIAARANELTDFRATVENVSTRRAVSEFEAVGRVVAQVGGEIDGTLSRAYNRLRQTTRDAIREQTIGLPPVRAEIERQTQAVLRLAASTGKVSYAQAIKEIRNAGDISTRFAQRFQLASQQAAFALDDFFSVTGGIEQRVRAVGNNVTQLGVVLGGATGLWAALAAVLTTQAVVALAKWTNRGIDATDKTKALSEALASQKGTVDSLKSSFERLADSVSEGVFTSANKDIRAFKSEIKSLQEEQARVRRESAIVADPEVFKARQELSRVNRDIEKETNPERLSQLLSQRSLAQFGVEAARRSALGRAKDPAGAVFDRISVGAFEFAKEIQQSLQRNARNADFAASQGVIGIGPASRRSDDAASRFLDARKRLVDAGNIENEFQRTEAQSAARREVFLINLGNDSREKELQSLANVARSVEVFGASLDKAGLSLASTVTGEARSAAEQARREDNANAARRVLGLSPEGSGRSQAFREAARVAEIREREIQREATLARDVFESSAALGRIGKDARDIIGRRGEAQRVLDSATSTDFDRRAAQRAVNEAQQQLGDIFLRSPAARRIEQLANAADVEFAKVAQQERLLERGRELTKRPGDNVARQIVDDIAALRAVGAGDADVRRVQEEAFRGLAPTLFGLQDQVQNAFLRGPSRAALNPTDVSTVEGSRELTRLLRGEDSARDQDLVAVNKEGNEILRAIERKLELENAN